MSSQLIVALDVATLGQAKRLVNVLSPDVKIFKVGLQLFTACGPDIFSVVKQRGADVFLDLKFHDIPHTVARATEAATRQGVFMVTLHTLGGEAMLLAARAAAVKTARRFKKKRPLLIGVTELTSSQARGVRSRVSSLARLASRCGLDGVVASARECAMLRREQGKKFIIVTPGIRPTGADCNDQKRVATPRAAVEAGANFLVVGRPIIGADSPKKAAQKIGKQMGVQDDDG